MIRPEETVACPPDSWVYPLALRDAVQFHGRNRAWAERQAHRLPQSFQAHVLAGWDERYGIPHSEKNGSIVARANVYAVDAVADFGDARAGSAYDEGMITERADNYARLCSRMKSRERRAEFVASFGIEPPEGPRMTPASASARMDDPRWWRRQLRKVWTRAAEDAMRRAGIIRKGRAAYASDEAVRHKANRERRTREWMEQRVMVNGEGEQLELLSLHEKSLANPALRRGEFMTRMRGFEEIARDLGHVALFFTLTAPSAFHAQHSGGGVNQAWEAAARPRVRDAQAWLRKQWAKARAKLARLSILYYGFRVAEPHHDATPHWHMVLFSSPAGADTLRTVLRGIWLREYADERGASEHRIKCEAINPERGSATGYIAKYVAKNIDGAGAIGDAVSDETGESVSSGVARVAAWASVHGIRQFQQIGGPPVGLWRECRRVRERTDNPDIERARAAADAGKWREFIDALGGLERAKKRVHSVREKYQRLCVVTPENAHEFPRVWMDKADPKREDAHGREVIAATCYGELAQRRPCGVVAFGLLGRWATLDTRRHRWRIEKSAPGSPQGEGHHARKISGSPCMTGTAAVLRSDSSPRSGVRSDLGPVAITVRRPELEAAEVQRAKDAQADEMAGRQWRRSYAERPDRPPKPDELERIANKARAISTPATNPERFGPHVRRKQ